MVVTLVVRLKLLISRRFAQSCAGQSVAFLYDDTNEFLRSI